MAEDKKPGVPIVEQAPEEQRPESPALETLGAPAPPVPEALTLEDSTLIGVGSASVLSRAVGKKDQSTIDKIMGNLVALNLIFGIIIIAVGMIFTRQLLTLSGAEGEILNNAERYLRIIFAGSLFVNFAQSSNMIMRGEDLLKKQWCLVLVPQL